MSVVSLVILLENVAYALVHVAWGVVVVGAPALVVVEVLVMGMDAGKSDLFSLSFYFSVENQILWVLNHHALNASISSGGIS